MDQEGAEANTLQIAALSLYTPHLNTAHRSEQLVSTVVYASCYENKSVLFYDITNLHLYYVYITIKTSLTYQSLHRFFDVSYPKQNNHVHKHPLCLLLIQELPYKQTVNLRLQSIQCKLTTAGCRFSVWCLYWAMDRCVCGKDFLR